MVSITNILISVLAAVVAVDAHAIITAPPHRANFNEATEVIPPCGKATLGSRASFLIKGGNISMKSFHPTATVIFQLALTANPKEADFKYTIIPKRSVPSGVTTFKNIDLTKAATGVTLKNGDVATIRFKFDGGDGTLYDCSDVTLKA
ncbi:hypothetical protein HDU97_006266 [Phlyctochytrium planicorne]|nr:hypothetical protein HDU97_006266 [Phlyctochytrium planicorne]